MIMTRSMGSTGACASRADDEPVTGVGRIPGAPLETTKRLPERRAHVETLRAKLPTPIANYSANASRYVEELTRLDGKARELVEQRFGVETQRLAAAERQLNDAERALADLANTATEVRHVIGALQDFSMVQQAMTTPNRGRLLRALLDRVVVEETSGRVDIHLVDSGLMLSNNRAPDRV